MPNGVVVQIAVPSVLAAVSVCLFMVYRKRNAQHREPSHSVPPVRPKPMPVAAVRKPVEAERAPAPLPLLTTETAILAETTAPRVASIPESPKPAVVLHAPPLNAPEDRNQRILAGISENIRRSTIKPVPTYSPLQFPQPSRETEYVRVKKKILTPHGQVRFSILKDSISINMLAVIRRACLDWKTAGDLVEFLPPYLEPEAEIFDNQLLLVGTPGHNEKLAIPIRGAHLDARIRDCFDFVTDDRNATNTPAVLLVNDDDFEIVSRGVITQPVFLMPERGHTEVKFLVEKYPEALQNG